MINILIGSGFLKHGRQSNAVHCAQACHLSSNSLYLLPTAMTGQKPVADPLMLIKHVLVWFPHIWVSHTSHQVVSL